MTMTSPLRLRALLNRGNVQQWARGFAAGVGRNFDALPIIDVGAVCKPDASLQDKIKVAQKLDEACRNVGFFYVVNHNVPKEIYDGVRDAARDWFSLPVELKNQIALASNKHFRGYQSLGQNVTAGKRDWHEAIDLYKEVEPAIVAQKGLPHSPIHGPNQWPHHSPDLVKLLKDYVAHMNQLGGSIMRGIALGLGIREDYFGGERAGVDDAYWCMRVIHYPPLAESSDKVDPKDELKVDISCGEHTDYGLLTFVNQDPHITALQVKNAAGKWVDASPIPGSFVCNIGDMLKIWTNGLYQPTAHRVTNADPSSSRVSIPFFFEPCYEARVEPISELLSSKPLFPAIRYGSHLERKVLNNFDL